MRKLKGIVKESTLQSILANKAQETGYKDGEVEYWTGKNLFVAIRKNATKWFVFMVTG